MRQTFKHWKKLVQSQIRDETEDVRKAHTTNGLWLKNDAGLHILQLF